jgi:hypothetical protein
MSEGATGRCLCGAVRLRAHTTAIAVRACWCRDCQYFAAGNATVNAIFRRTDVTVTSEMGEFVSSADSSNIMHRHFCPLRHAHTEPVRDRVRPRSGARGRARRARALRAARLHLDRIRAGLGLHRPASAEHSGPAGRLERHADFVNMQ